MKLGIMQPYFVPYIGYWQLMNAVDEYVIYDDVNFIKGGWINRNRILVNDQPKYFNVPMLGASSMKHINEVGVNNDPKLIVSSTLEKDCTLKGQDKVLEICKLLGATEYYNAIGGQELYSFADFRQQGVKLSFLKTEPITYDQFGGEFQPNLSIVDVMMFNSADTVREMLGRYQLVCK